MSHSSCKTHTLLYTRLQVEHKYEVLKGYPKSGEACQKDGSAGPRLSTNMRGDSALASQPPRPE